jgi:hypothetical protein
VRDRGLRDDKLCSFPYNGANNRQLRFGSTKGAGPCGRFERSRDLTRLDVLASAFVVVSLCDFLPNSGYKPLLPCLRDSCADREGIGWNVAGNVVEDLWNLEWVCRGHDEGRERRRGVVRTQVNAQP